MRGRPEEDYPVWQRAPRQRPREFPRWEEAAGPPAQRPRAHLAPHLCQPPFTVCRSGAEQTPYFVGQPWCETRAMRTGDYSVIGHHDPGTPEEPQGLVIERKGPEDLYQSLSRGRERLEKEAERMLSFERRAIVCELDYRDLLDPERGHHPRQLLAGVLDRLQAQGHPDHAVIREVLKELGWWTRDDLWRSQARPAAIEGTLLTWADRYGIEVHLAGSHRLGERWCFRRLATWWRERHPEVRL